MSNQDQNQAPEADKESQRKEEVKPTNKVLVDFDELEECYRMAVNHIRDVAVDIDEESALLLSICRVKGAINSHNRKMKDIK